MTPYTPAQLRAFAWLPADGSWRGIYEGRNDLWVTLEYLFRINLCQLKMGESFDIYRLTPAGIAERARLVKEGVIK